MIHVCLLILQCLVIGEITCDHMIVVLNKIDLVEPSKREAQIAKVTNPQPVAVLGGGSKVAGGVKVRVHISMLHLGASGGMSPSLDSRSSESVRAFMTASLIVILLEISKFLV